LHRRDVTKASPSRSVQRFQWTHVCDANPAIMLCILFDS
jgi:hypothetical protein